MSRFLNTFGRARWEAVKTVIKYLKGTSTAALQFSGDRVQLTAYMDSGYAADAENRKSISGYVAFIGRSAVTWSLHKQRIVATSTAEAECITLAHCAREVLFLQQLLSELSCPQASTSTREDNQACMTFAQDPAQHARTKHIDVRYHFVRAHTSIRELALEYVASKMNTADMMTKALARDQFVLLRDRLGLVKFEPNPAYEPGSRSGSRGSDAAAGASQCRHDDVRPHRASNESTRELPAADNGDPKAVERQLELPLRRSADGRK